MSKKIQREFRDRHLNSAEAAVDRDLREQVKKEFPPTCVSAPSQSSSLSELLRATIRQSAKSLDEIASQSGVSPILITRFLAGERDIHMTTADKLASTLGLEVTTE